MKGVADPAALSRLPTRVSCKLPVQFRRSANMGTTSRRLTIPGILAVSAVALFIASCGAQPAAAATPQRYTVFFDFNSTAVRPSAAQVIARAAATAKERQAQHSFSHVKVIGYADAAGSAAASQRLSEQRAAVVRDALT